jgi:hypothetical protein
VKLTGQELERLFDEVIRVCAELEVEDSALTTVRFSPASFRVP